MSFKFTPFKAIVLLVLAVLLFILGVQFSKQYSAESPGVEHIHPHYNTTDPVTGAGDDLMESETDE